MAADNRATASMSGYLQVPSHRILHDTAVTERPGVPILVVDDDEMKRFALRRLLAPLGYDVVEAVSGLAALRCVLAQDFALILLDVRMPGMDGFETAALLRSRARSELTPILLSTASTRDEIIASGMYGDSVTHFMLAPVEPDELRATVAVFANLFLKAQELVAQAHQVQVNSDHWRLLTDVAPVGIFQTDRHHRYTHTNPRWSEITGIPPETALGQDWQIIMTAEQASRFVNPSGAEGVHWSDVSHRIQLRVPGSDPKVALLSVKQLRDTDGGPAGWVGALTDLTATT